MNQVSYDDILNIMDEADITHRKDLAYKVGIVILWTTLNPEPGVYQMIEASREKRIVKLSFGTVLKIHRNLRRNGILKDGNILWETPWEKVGTLEWIVEFTLLCMAGAGEVMRYTVPNEEEPEFKKGDVVKLSDKYIKESYHVRHPERTGVIAGKSRNPNLVIVKWNGNKNNETYSKNFITHIQPIEP